MSNSVTYSNTVKIPKSSLAVNRYTFKSTNHNIKVPTDKLYVLEYTYSFKDSTGFNESVTHYKVYTSIKSAKAAKGGISRFIKNEVYKNSPNDVNIKFKLITFTQSNESQI